MHRREGVNVAIQAQIKDEIYCQPLTIISLMAVLLLHLPTKGLLHAVFIIEASPPP